MIVKPFSYSSYSVYAVVGLLSAVFAAGASVAIRQLSARHHTYEIVFYFLAVATLVAIPLMWNDFVVPATLREWGLLLAIGVVSLLGQVFPNPRLQSRERDHRCGDPLYRHRLQRRLGLAVLERGAGRADHRRRRADRGGVHRAVADRRRAEPPARPAPAASRRTAPRVRSARSPRSGGGCRRSRTGARCHASGGSGGHRHRRRSLRYRARRRPPAR